MSEPRSYRRSVTRALMEPTRAFKTRKPHLRMQRTTKQRHACLFPTQDVLRAGMGKKDWRLSFPNRPFLATHGT